MEMDEKNDAGVACLDLTEALDRAMGDAPFLEMLLSEYVEKLPGIVDSLTAAFQTREAVNLRNIAHTLKGMSANLGCTSVFQVAMQLEEVAGKSEWNTCEALLLKLDKAVQKTKTHIAQIDWSAFS